MTPEADHVATELTLQMFNAKLQTFEHLQSQMMSSDGYHSWRKIASSIAALTSAAASNRSSTMLKHGAC